MLRSWTSGGRFPVQTFVEYTPLGYGEDRLGSIMGISTVKPPCLTTY